MVWRLSLRLENLKFVHLIARDLQTYTNIRAYNAFLGRKKKLENKKNFQKHLEQEIGSQVLFSPHFLFILCVQASAPVFLRLL